MTPYTHIVTCTARRSQENEAHVAIRAYVVAELGHYFEREIREQPEVWERVARGDASERLARAFEGEIVFVGSGSSLFAAQLGALALRRRGIGAHAVAATEALGDNLAYRGRVLVAISQSGRSSDLLGAIETLQPRRTVALTNTAQSPLSAIADLTIDVRAGLERAIPASKSISATFAILLTAASACGGGSRTSNDLLAAARAVRAWLDGSAFVKLTNCAEQIARRRQLVILGTGYGVPIAHEAALKFKEATYLHAEGFEAGEFRHGSAAMVDSDTVVLGITDDDAAHVVGRPLAELAGSGALRYAIGSRTIDGVPKLGPDAGVAYDTLGALVTLQILALQTSRVRGIDADAPRGLKKTLVSE